MVMGVMTEDVSDGSLMKIVHKEHFCCVWEVYLWDDGRTIERERPEDECK